MKIEEIGIYTGKPEFEFKPIRRIEVKCEATTALMPAPTIEEANGRLRALAAKAGANAVVQATYKTGVSFTSWKSLKAEGLAVYKISDEATCSVCAETIKRAATKCRYCGTDRVPETANDVSTVPETGQNTTNMPEPLRENNNPAILIGLVIIAGVIIITIMHSLAS